MPKVSMKHRQMAELIENFQASPKQFYASVEEAVARRQIPDSENSRVDWHEAGPLSVNREYLRISRGEHKVDVCGAPFGTGFFVSTWLVEERNSLGLIEIAILLAAFIALPILLVYILGITLGMMATLVGWIGGPVLLFQYLNSNRPGWDDFMTLVPYLGPIYERLARPDTYYKLDTATMFHQAVHNSVVEIVNGMTEAKGVRGLSDGERRLAAHAAAGAYRG